MDFLSNLFENGLQYSTINLYRSAISSCHPHIDNVPVGEHPTVCKLLKGIKRSRPPAPKYSFTWDVNSVLSYLDSLGDNASLNLKMLTLKLVTLLALTSAKRCGELSRFNVKYMRVEDDTATFTLPHLSKTGKANCKVVFTNFKENINICPITCLSHYIGKTANLRDVETESLLISFVKPHKGVKPCTVGRWLKCVLQQAGIDTSIFTAHSTRGASCSKAYTQGSSVSDILQMANWSNVSTFKKFYQREITPSTFSDLVLSANNNK